MEGIPRDVPAALTRPPRKIKVFILEDEPVASQLYADLLTAIPGQFQIHKFTDGDEAWAELTKVDPDILITDIVHPGLDGWEMLKLLAVEKVSYPILVLTGDCQSVDFYKDCYPDLKLGMLGKPFRIQSFYQLLSALLQNRDGIMPAAKQAVVLARNNGMAALA